MSIMMPLTRDWLVERVALTHRKTRQGRGLGFGEVVNEASLSC